MKICPILEEATPKDKRSRCGLALVFLRSHFLDIFHRRILIEEPAALLADSDVLNGSATLELGGWSSGFSGR